MIKKSLIPAVLILLLTPNLAQACYNSGVDPFDIIPIGIVSIVFGLISGYYRRTAGSPFYRFLFRVNAGSYILIIFLVPQVQPLCRIGLFVLVMSLLALALAQAIALAIAARKARREASSETDGPGAARLRFSSAGLLLVALAMIFSTLSTEGPHRVYRDADVKASLHNYFLACEAYWADEGGDNTCSLEIAKQASYGFNQIPRMRILTEGGNESSFTAFAAYRNSYSVFKMDHAGNIEESAYNPFPPPKTRWELFLENIGVSDAVPEE